MNTKRILAFHMEKARLDGLRGICGPQGIEVLSVPPEKERVSIGHLAGVAGLSARAAEDAEGAVAEEMIVFVGVDDQALDQVLAAMKDAAYAQVQLKAIVTPINSAWSARRLYRELKREAAQVAVAQSKLI